MQLIPRPTPLPTGIEGWLATFAGPFLGAVHMDKRNHVVAEIRDLLKWSTCDEQGRWTVDCAGIALLLTADNTNDMSQKRVSHEHDVPDQLS